MFPSSRKCALVAAYTLALSSGCSHASTPANTAAKAHSAGGEATARTEPCLSQAMPDDSARLLCLLRVAGAADVFGGSDLRSALHEQLAPQLDKLAPEQRASIEQVIDARFADGTLESRFRELFLARYDGQSVSAMLAFYATPLGQKLSAQREEDPSMEQLNAWFEKNQPTEPRVEQVTKILRASHAFESIAVMVALPVEGLYRVLAPLTDGGEAPTEEQLGEAVAPAVQEAQTAVAAQTVYSFRVFDDRELSELASFEEQGAAQWYHQGLLVALTTTLHEAFAALQESVQAAKSSATKAAEQPG